MGVDASTAGCRLHPPFRSISSVCHSSSTLPEDQHSLFFFPITESPFSPTFLLITYIVPIDME
jgi:hypothetical protein